MEKNLELQLANMNPSEITKEQEDALFYRVAIDEQESEHLAAEPYSYWKSVFRVFRGKTSAKISIACLVLMIISMIIVPLFAPDGAYNSNLTIMNQAPSLDHLWTMETIGDTTGVVEGGLGREATDKELSGSVTCDGFGSSFAALFGVLPNTSFSQNVGLVGMTKVVNRYAIAMGAGILVLAGLFPKIGAVINIMPQPVLGGAAVMMFANIVISGINLITKEPLTGRNATVVAIALGLGFGLGSSSAIQGFMPEWLKYAFGGSGIVPAGLIAILLNILLPADSRNKT